MRRRRRTRASGRVLRLVAGPGCGFVQLFEWIHRRLRCRLPHFAARLIRQRIAHGMNHVGAGLVGQSDGAAGLRRQSSKAGERHRHAGCRETESGFCERGRWIVQQGIAQCRRALRFQRGEGEFAIVAFAIYRDETEFSRLGFALERLENELAHRFVSGLR